MGYILTADAVRATSQAMIDLIQENNISGPIIVGGDTRFLSEEFAKTAAEIFAGNADAFSKSGEPAVIFMDIPTGNFDSEGNPERKPYVPTPAMTFAIRKYNAAGGVTMTASHNFGEDNGYKSLREHYGGLAPQRVTIALQDRANSLLKNNSIMRYTSFEKACRLNKIQKVNIRDAYFEEHLMSLVDFNVISKSEPNVAVDLLYGTGIGFLDKILELAGCRIKKCYHNWRDPNFGGRRPDCEDENNIHEMVEFVKTNSDVEVGLSVDSDGDRFGVVGKKGLINANHIIAMLFYYLFHFKNNKSLPVCRTIVTTHMLDAMAKKLGVKILALPYIGFKWIGDMMNDEKMSFIIAGEESSGLSIGNFPEKDGILADILVLEMICKIGQDEVTSEKRTGRKIKPLHELLEQLQEEFGAWHFHRRDLYGIRRKQKVMDFFRKKYRPKEIAGHQMENSSIIAGMFDKFKKKGRPIDENPWGINPLVGDGVKYYLKIRPEDQWKYDDGVVGAWVHIRESGNEPVIRIYTQHRTNRHALNEIEEEIERLIWKIDIQI
jgi:phosphomannomutase